MFPFPPCRQEACDIKAPLYFRMIDINKPEVQNVLYSIVHSALLETGGGNTDVMPQEAKLDTATALIFDSVHAFAMALHELSSVQQVFLLVLY